MHIPAMLRKLHSTLQKPFCLAAAMAPVNTPNSIPSTAAAKPIMSELFTLVFSTLLTGTPLYRDVPLPKSPFMKFFI